MRGAGISAVTISRIERVEQFDDAIDTVDEAVAVIVRVGCLDIVEGLIESDVVFLIRDGMDDVEHIAQIAVELRSVSVAPPSVTAVLPFFCVTATTTDYTTRDVLRLASLQLRSW